ncbi:MAG: response regulator [Candidatus Limnocylindria bacterium]
MTERSNDGATKGKRVLVVNDTQEILELFQDILEAMGFDVVLMSYAPRELDRVREVAPDLIVLDFLMGEREMLGWQLLQKLKMDRQLDSIPIVVCTAAVRAVAEQQGYLTEQGVLVVLKPFNVDQLEEAVRRAVSIPKTAREVVVENRA